MGRLIVFEGIDGSGKTTLSQMFHTNLLENGVPSVWLREPTDSALGNKIRLLAQDKESISIHEELKYFLEDRRWDVENNILPALRSGKTVVLDRYYYSNACYQGARGLDVEGILRANREFAPEPDIVFIIDVEVDRALARISSNRPGVAKLFEKKDFLEKVRANYLKLAGANLVRIDGNPELEIVSGEVTRLYRMRALKDPATPLK
ncbi:MAG: dTMP kinase [Candidatus Aminicenantes bacterium]|nr:dTMP kinase [Candidatus Aminicenantes bacterium]